MLKTRYLSKDFSYTEYPEVKALIGINGLEAKGFSGKRSKPDFYICFRDEDHRDRYITKYLDRLKKTAEYKTQRKIENKGKLSTSAAAAVEIRKSLKKAFPGIKFSVTSESYSMGNSVNVSWTDGPMHKLVDAIVNMYRYGRFDGIQDLSYDVDIDPRLNCGGTQHTGTSRERSPELENQLKNYCQNHFEENGIGYYSPWQYEEAELALLGKNKDWLMAECTRLQELILGPAPEQASDLQTPEGDQVLIGLCDQVWEDSKTKVTPEQEIEILEPENNSSFGINEFGKIKKSSDDFWEDNIIESMVKEGNVINLAAWKASRVS